MSDDPTFTFYIAKDNSIADGSVMESVGFTPEKIKQEFGDEYTYREVWLKDAVGARDLEIKRLCKPDGVADGALEPYARIAAMVLKWNFTGAPTMQYVQDSLHTNTIAYLNQKILLHMFPSGKDIDFFTKALKKSPDASETENGAV